MCWRVGRDTTGSSAQTGTCGQGQGSEVGDFCEWANSNLLFKFADMQIRGESADVDSHVTTDVTNPSSGCPAILIAASGDGPVP